MASQLTRAAGVEAALQGGDIAPGASYHIFPLFYDPFFFHCTFSSDLLFQWF